VIRPCALEITAGDLAFAAGHRRIAISFVAGTLNSAAAFSIAVASSGASASPSHRANSRFARHRLHKGAYSMRSGESLRDEKVGPYISPSGG
jgi:hypothetical protein